MQKIRNRSNFFQKIFHIRYIAKNFENSTAFLKKSATSGIFPEFLKTFLLFRTFFKKSFYGILRQTGHRHFNNTLCANSPNSPKLPSTGVISSMTPLCVAPFRKNPKKTSPLHQCMPDFCPQNFHGFQKKLKNFYIRTYHITDFEWFMCQFELKAPSEKVQSCPTYIATLA